MNANPLEVWAPSAERVQLWVADADPGHGRLLPMVRGSDGWWRSESAPSGEFDYGFVLDAGDAVDGDEFEVRADPRSLRQPHGVHGLSRTFDPSEFAWTDSAWRPRTFAGSVIYELHVGTFTPEGTLDAAIGRLGHLVELGVDAVELLPVNAFNGHHNWGYDGVLWFAVHEVYGGPRAYQRFVDACHAHGLAVIQDVVYNHLGPSGNVLPLFGPYLHDSHSNTWGASLNLDGEGSGEVRRYILDNARMWFADYHVDGLRLDAVHALRDSSEVHLLEELSARTESLSAASGRSLILIAESDLNDPIMFRPRECGGFGLTAQWSDDFHHALHVALTGETSGYYADFASLDSLAKVLTHGFFHDGTWSSFRGREHGVPIDTEHTSAWRLVVASQNHDQIGNRASGDRLTATLSRGRLAIAAAITLLSPFTPMLFMGEEWGASTPWQFFTSHPEPDLGAKTAAGRLEEFARMDWGEAEVPDPQDPETFSRSHLDWSEAERDPNGLLPVYRALIRLRRSLPELSESAFTDIEVDWSDSGRYLTMRRGRLTLIANFSDRPLALDEGVSADDIVLIEGDDVHSDVHRAVQGDFHHAVHSDGDAVLNREDAVHLRSGPATDTSVPGPGLAVVICQPLVEENPSGYK